MTGGRLNKPPALRRHFARACHCRTLTECLLWCGMAGRFAANRKPGRGPRAATFPRRRVSRPHRRSLVGHKPPLTGIGGRTFRRRLRPVTGQLIVKDERSLIDVSCPDGDSKGKRFATHSISGRAFLTLLPVVRYGSAASRLWRVSLG